MRVAVEVGHVAAGTARNWTLTDWVPGRQVHDLWEAVHEILSLVLRGRPDGEDKLVEYSDEYDRGWPSPRFREKHQRHPGHGRPA